MTTENNTLDLPEENPQEGVFKFEPIKGYPMLNWKGKRPFTSTRYYPAQLKEQHGEAVNGWLNKIFWGDNLQVMSHLLREFRGKVDLIYIDPPFDSNADYKKKIVLNGEKVNNDQNVFEEKQYTDIWSNDEYLQFMYERIILLKELLSEKGAIYLHCDSKKSHHLRCILDEVFGQENFLNDVVWCYSDAANSKKYWNTKHDTILYYKKGSLWTFNYEKVLREHTEENIKKYKYEDEIGRYRLFGKNIQGSPIQWHRDVSPEWEKTNPELVFRHYLKEGSLPLDWWTINPVNQAAKERQAYPTQKPEKLLEQILIASSNEGDLIFDCFMGSGTAQNVAMKLGRKFIGADINLGAIQTTTKRLIKVAEGLKNTQPELDDEKVLYTGFEVYNVNHYDVFRNPVQAKELLIQALDIQPIPNSIYDGEKDGRMVKLMPVNHIATKADVADLIHGVDYKAFEKRKEEKPNQPVEKITLICMGHEPDLAAFVEQSIGYKLDIQVVDILRDRSDLQFKRDSEALFKVENGQLVVDKFYPMNLLQKLSQTKDTVSDWREMVESIMIDWNYDGAVFQPALTDIPAKNELVQGAYTIPEDAGTIRIKITDLLSESLERNLTAEEMANG
ncbi:site-specific DNA-methyltransferase [Acinetobacter baumannii]|uniref:site-specific DNA-methyltransferase n=1 Tax=Acinetobacter TaxID=469 RepID=UPI00125FB901|nr:MULTISPECIES: site-specific DNA-methyltransferase [Acinetobacter]MBE4722377.1 site-specific DNA-methyltransferase [Acinetobacter baumannii]